MRRFGPQPEWEGEPEECPLVRASGSKALQIVDQQRRQRRSRPMRVAFYNCLIDGMKSDEFLRLCSLGH